MSNIKQNEEILQMDDKDKNSWEISRALNISREKVVKVITDMLKNPSLPEKRERRSKELKEIKRKWEEKNRGKK